MKTDIDTCLGEIADWYIENKREMSPKELEPIVSKHYQDEKETVKFVQFLATESGKLRFKTLLREREEAGISKERMPRINPHATAIQQDKQLAEQIKWLKTHGFKTARDAQEAGY